MVVYFYVFGADIKHEVRGKEGGTNIVTPKSEGFGERYV
jgi:hypothetical protein